MKRPASSVTVLFPSIGLLPNQVIEGDTSPQVSCWAFCRVPLPNSIRHSDIRSNHHEVLWCVTSHHPRWKFTAHWHSQIDAMQMPLGFRASRQKKRRNYLGTYSTFSISSSLPWYKCCINCTSNWGQNGKTLHFKACPLLAHSTVPPRAMRNALSLLTF